MRKIRLDGWSQGAETISAIRLLQQASSLGLAESKRSVEHVLEGGAVEFTPCDPICLENWVAEMGNCGFHASVVES
jgi:hypothetical protein